MSARVCLLSPAPLWINPRLRKEADALYSAGYDVVVGYRADGDITRDDAILARRPWAWHRFDVSRARKPARWLASGVRQHVAERLWRAGLRGQTLERATYCRADDQMLSWAVAQHAHLYIAHTQPALPIAALASAASRSAFAFDCEDLLAEEAADGGRARWRRTLINEIQQRYLSRAAYVSATSVPMAEYLASTYRLDEVRVWHNCFPAPDRESVRPPDARHFAEPVELAWISATIGPGRGLEDVFSALQRLGSAVRLHMYGHVPEASATWLRHQLAGIPEGLAPVIHPPVPSDTIMQVLAGHHVGLSVDGIDCLNRSLTIPNKLFYYLQAGLACVVTDTPGHRSVLGDDVRFGIRYRPGDIDALVAAIKQYLVPNALAEAQLAAWQAGQARYSWDREEAAFLRAVEEVLPGARSGTTGKMVGAGSV